MSLNCCFYVCLSFSMTPSLLNLTTMSWWLTKLRIQMIKCPWSRMHISGISNRRTLKSLYALSLSLSCISFSVEFHCFTQGSHYCWTENWTYGKEFLWRLCPWRDFCKVQILAKGLWCLQLERGANMCLVLHQVT